MENNKRDFWQEKTLDMKFNINGNQVSDIFTVSNAFNNYFVETGPQLERSIHTTVNTLNPQVTVCSCLMLMNMR